MYFYIQTFSRICLLTLQSLVSTKRSHIDVDEDLMESFLVFQLMYFKTFTISADKPNTENNAFGESLLQLISKIVLDNLVNLLQLTPFYFNTRIYNLNFAPQITRFSLIDAMISSKTNPCRRVKKVKRDNCGSQNNINYFVMYLSAIYKSTKQYSGVLLQFTNLKQFVL